LLLLLPPPPPGLLRAYVAAAGAAAKFFNSNPTIPRLAQGAPQQQVLGHLLHDPVQLLAGASTACSQLVCQDCRPAAAPFACLLVLCCFVTCVVVCCAFSTLVLCWRELFFSGSELAARLLWTGRVREPPLLVTCRKVTEH
jgi:hypothetical protein